MTTSITTFLESWDWFSRTLYVHKLEKPKGDHTIESLQALKDAKIIGDINDVYIYSFIHPDTNSVVSFTGSNLLVPNKEFKAWYTYVNPMRGFIYKGAHEFDPFSSERIGTNKFETQSFLFTGERNIFSKVMEIPCEAISTAIPVPLPGIIGIYENIRFRCKPNKYNLNNIQFKKFKLMFLPQIILKSNYMFIYNVNTYDQKN